MAVVIIRVTKIEEKDGKYVLRGKVEEIIEGDDELLRP